MAQWRGHAPGQATSSLLKRRKWWRALPGLGAKPDPNEPARSDLGADVEEVMELTKAIDNATRHTVHVYDETGERIELELPQNERDATARRRRVDGSAQ